MPRLRLRLRLGLWPNGSVRPDAKPWANKDVFACFANASGINTHQFQPPAQSSLSLPLCGTCLICNQKRKFVSATACPLSMFQSMLIPVSLPVPPYCVPVCVSVCVRLVCFDDECVVPFFLYILGCTCHSSCLCKWSTFLSLLDCIAGALAFAYCTPFPWGGKQRGKPGGKALCKNWVKLCHRFA